MFEIKKIPPTKFDNYIKELEGELFININKEIPNEEGSIKVEKRMVYREKLEIESVNIRVVFLINKGQWFKQTVSFNVYSDVNTDFISVSEGFQVEKKLFRKNDFEKISNYIINKIKKERIITNVINTKNLKTN